MNASQFRSRYSQTTAPMNAIVKKIFTNSPMKNVAGVAPSGFCVPANRRRANSAFGTTQLAPPSSADHPALAPPSPAASSETAAATANCIKTTPPMPIPIGRPSFKGKRQIRKLRDYKGLYLGASNVYSTLTAQAVSRAFLRKGAHGGGSLCIETNPRKELRRPALGGRVWPSCAALRNGPEPALRLPVQAELSRILTGMNGARRITVVSGTI